MLGVVSGPVALTGNHLCLVHVFGRKAEVCHSYHTANPKLQTFPMVDGKEKEADGSGHPYWTHAAAYPADHSEKRSIHPRCVPIQADLLG